MKQYPWWLSSRRNFVIWLALIFFVSAVLLLVVAAIAGFPMGLAEVVFVVAVGTGGGLLSGFGTWELFIKLMMKKYDKTGPPFRRPGQ